METNSDRETNPTKTVNSIRHRLTVKQGEMLVTVTPPNAPDTVSMVCLMQDTNHINLQE